MAVSVRVINQGKEVLVAACDADLLGRVLKFGKIDFPVRREFYGGEILTPEETLNHVREATTVNLLGEEVVGHAVRAGLVHPEAVIYVSGVPHAMIIKV